MANVKIKVSIGTIQFTGEGEENWVEKQLDKIIDHAPGLLKVVPAVSAHNSGKGETGLHENTLQLTTGSIASKLGCKTGSDLVKAATARLTLVGEKAKFHRKDILAEMQSASAFYKESYTSNLSKYLTGLVKKNVLLEQSSGVYALHEDSKNSLRALLD